MAELVHSSNATDCAEHYEPGTSFICDTCGRECVSDSESGACDECRDEMLARVCPGCHVVAPERCLPGCIDAEMALERENEQTYEAPDGDDGYDEEYGYGGN